MKPTIPQVLPLLQDYYDRHPGGGALHIFIEDYNIEDGHMLGCYDSATHGPERQKWEEHMREQFPRSGAAERSEAEPLDYEGAALALVLLAMSKTQRGKIARMVTAR